MPEVKGFSCSDQNSQALSTDVHEFKTSRQQVESPEKDKEVNMPSKTIYKTVFNEETKKFEIRAANEFGTPNTKYGSPPFDTIEDARSAMDELKRDAHDRNGGDPFHEVVYVNLDQFEIINHRD